MAYKLPWSNFHELNLDWILEKIKKLQEDVANITGSAMPSSSIPEMAGVGSPGTEDNYARGDHRHPTDTSRAAQTDLAQEILDRGTADHALDLDIQAVDEKIKFSAAAPIMDSSSASAGFSDFLARADHVHPTDTSRASATELAILTTRVDNIVGAASPYDVMPLMDGAGSYGTVGAYSRGDHQHPSDSSKLDTAGGTITGDLTIKGSLSEELRMRYITTNAVGWLRAIQTPLVYGTRIEITISRKGTIAPAEEHKITYVYNQAGAAFVDEYSTGDVKYIDKIRITDAGRIDIHMDQTADSQIGVFIRVAAPTDTAETNIQMLEIEGVADAPAGETVLTTHDFETNTEANGTITASTGSSGISTVSYLSKKRGIVYGNIVAVANSITANTWTDIATIPAEFCRTGYIDIVAIVGWTTVEHARVYADGQVAISPKSSITSGTAIMCLLTYPLY